jgi:hypothetical protein
MTETKWTPGVWTAHTRPDGSFSIESRRRPTILCQRAAWRHRAEESIANARLIAAAPEMADFAQNVAGLQEQSVAGMNINTLRATLREYRDEARAILAKAQGET